jgi:TonB family protein
MSTPANSGAKAETEMPVPAGLPDQSKKESFSIQGAEVTTSSATNQLPQGPNYEQLAYIPRELLSAVPLPLAEIEIPFPDSLSGDISVRIQLEVYIDERGVVQKVRVDSSQALVLLEDAAVNAFLAARFKAGQIDGQDVRSLIRVEVSFESRSSDKPGQLRKPTVSM